MNRQTILLALLGLSIVSPQLSTCLAQGGAFTYQGFLSDGGAPANGVYDLTFTLFDSATGGNAVGTSNVVNDLGVTNGLFTVALDFTAAVFDGSERWMQVAVRPGASGGSYTDVIPRQQITSTPYAIRAANFSGPVATSQLTGTILSNNIGAGSITTLMLAPGAVGSNQLAAGAVTTDALATGAVTAGKVATVSNWFALTIANPTPAVRDYFGCSVAAVGSDRVVIGAFYDGTAAFGAGAAYLLRTDGTLLTTFTNPTPAFRDSFGWSLAAVGTDRVLVGAYGDDTGAEDAGAAYLFSTNGALLTTFTNPTPTVGAYFGYTVAAVGTDRVLIGAYGHDGDDANAGDVGAAYLFSTSGTLLTTFTNPTPQASDNFGVSVVAVGTDRVLIGAYGDETGAGDAGAAYLFSTNGALLTTFTNPTPTASDYFGISVAAVGTDRVLIGAYGDETGAGDAGAAYLFSTNGALLTTFTNPTAAASDYFGRSVAAVGAARVLIGAYLDDTGVGAAYLFGTDGTLLTTFTNPTPGSDDWFGLSVAAVGTDRVLIGALGDDTGATAAGAAYLYSIETFAPGFVADGVRARSITTGSLDDGAVTLAKLDPVLGVAVNGLVRSNLWQLGGNAGTTPGAHFLGTADNRPLELKVNGTRALRIEPNTNGAPNLIGGAPVNFVDPGVVGATIGGGGAVSGEFFLDAGSNRVSGSFGTIGGGQANQIETNALASTINGGWLNAIQTRAYNANVGGYNATIAGGLLNVIGSPYASIGGGGRNTVGTNSNTGVICGGFANAIANHSWDATIGGGSFHSVGTNASFATVGGGQGNAIRDNAVSSTVAGGKANGIGLSASNSTVGGGYANVIWDDAHSSTIAGGVGNVIQIRANQNTIGGGYANAIRDNATSSTIAGGTTNVIGFNADSCAIGGGQNNTIWDNAFLSAIAGGLNNRIGLNASRSTIAGGEGNTIWDAAFFSTIAGGYGNAIGPNATHAFAAGRYANANHARSFVWSSRNNGAPSFMSDRFQIHCLNGLAVDYDVQRVDGFGTKWVLIGAETQFPGQTISAHNGAHLSTGGAWVNGSDRNVKTAFAPVDPQTVLEKVVALPVLTWSYTNEAPGIRHLGPMAQDFYAAFGLGQDDKGIGTVDADGVALAAIQGLNAKLEDRTQKAEDRIQQLEAQNAELKQALKQLTELVNAMNPKPHAGR